MKLQSTEKPLKTRHVLIAAALVVALIGGTLATQYASIQQQRKSSLSREQVIQILKESELTDPYDRLIKDEQLDSLELGTISPNLKEYIQELGNYDRLYVSPTRIKSSKIYWEAQFITNGTRRNFAGRYILDALTGEVMLIHERGPTPGPRPIKFSFEPSSPYLRRGENTSVTLTVSGRPSYDVPWPPSINMNEVESGLTVSDMNETNRWDTDRTIMYSFVASMDAEAEAVKSSIRFDCELVGARIGFGYSVWTKRDP